MVASVVNVKKLEMKNMIGLDANVRIAKV